MSTPPDQDRGSRLREWEAQERALQDERRGRGMSARDPLVAEYRLLARVLSDPPLAPLPRDFAAAAAAWAARRAISDDRLEMWLQRLLVGLLLLAGIGVVAVTSAEWLEFVVGRLWDMRDFFARTGATSGAVWALVIATCVAVSAAVERWHRREA